ncbi:MAG: tetratricopeptide repeat protein [Nibricoccus sp.]
MPPSRAPAEAGPSRWRLAAVLFILVVAVFGNAVNGVFVFDDEPSIVNNSTIHGTAPGRWFSPPSNSTTVGRPLANATFAVNHLMSGVQPWSYHVVNILIHATAALTLFAVVRRIFRLSAWKGKFGSDESWLAFAAAALWAVHPLQAESVTYVVQRVESLAGLCCLLAVYCYLGSLDGKRPWIWQVGVVTACMVGAGVKETIVAAPLIVLVVDRTWIAGSFAESVRRRPWMYLGLASSWILLGLLVAGSANRSGTAGFGTASCWLYLLTQCRAVLLYLKLVIWPAPLIFDRGNALVSGVAEVWLEAVVIAAVGMVSVIAIAKRSSWGVAAFCFFALLAPSSSVVPVMTQTMAEHRMYLPLAAIVVACVLVVYRWFHRRAFLLFAAICLVWCGLTIRRNSDFSSNVRLWTDTVEKIPENWRARNNLALALSDSGRSREAIEHFKRILEHDPGSVEVRNNFANALVRVGRPSDALTQIDLALAAAPQIAELLDTRGVILLALGRREEAGQYFKTALKLKPELSEARLHLQQVE